MAKGFGSRGGRGGGGGGGGGGGMGGMQNLMKQATQMQDKIAKAQEEADAKEYDIEAAGGSIKLKINGKMKLLSLSLDESLLEDKETLEDVLLVGINEATGKVQEETKKITDQAGSGFKVPGLF